MPGNLKNSARAAESVIGVVNTDLTRTMPEVDPRFEKDDGPMEPSPPSGLTVTGKGAGAKISVQPQDLSRTLPPCPQRPPVFTWKGGRT